MADDFKYHIDHHASLVPPTDLVATRAGNARGDITDEALAAAEDVTINEILSMQRRLGLAAFSDGEFRRRNSLSVLYDGVDGFAPGDSSPCAELVGPAHAPEVRTVVATPSASGRLTKEEAQYLRGHTDRSTLVALPSPGFLAELTAVPAQAATTGAALAGIVRDEINALAGDGINYVLLRNPAYAFLLTDQGRHRAEALGIDAKAALARMLEADSQTLDGLTGPDEFRVGLDLTTGAQAPQDWNSVAVQEFLGRQPFDRLCVEYSGDVSERFPLELAPRPVVMSLGIVDVSSPELETVDELLSRIDAAAAVMDVDNIAISTNGGFHVPGAAAYGYQRVKLQRVEMVARYFWGNEL